MAQAMARVPAGTLASPCPTTIGRESSCSSSSSRPRKLRKNFGGRACSNVSPKLGVAVGRSPSLDTLKGKFSRRATGQACSALLNDVENAELDEITETKEEVLSQNSRVESTYLDKAGKTKLISVQDYMDQAPDFIRPDSGPPRWFCSLDARDYPEDAPLLLFVPGMDSLGLGLILQQKKLARLFEVQCLHIPLADRTPFVGLVEIVERRLREEADRRPDPIYILAESFGGCLAFSLAARNPKMDLVLVIVNPATSFADSPLQPFLPLLPILPDELLRLTPFLLSFTLGDPVRMASASVDSNLPPWERIPKISEALTALLPTLPVLSDIMPKETLSWKLKLLKDGAQYANSRIRGVRADILLLISGKDQMIPSADEGKRLKKLLPQIKIRYFPDSGHTLLLEGGLDVASLIKAALLLRHKKNSKYDHVNDFRPPFPEEIENGQKSIRVVRQLFSPIFLSDTENGQVRRGLPRLPEGRPLLFVSNHTLIGFDLGLIVDEFLNQKGILLRGLAHPLLSVDNQEMQEPGGSDLFRLFGIVPVTGSNLYKLLGRGEAALLYPGGVREALKRKGEAYKLFWSDTPEFVRTAIRHGATIIPFGSVGGDDIVEILFDKDDLLSLPLVGDYIRESSSKIPAARTSGTGEVTNEEFVTPLGYPKSPPRVYFYFKQPIPTEGMSDLINDREATEKLYLKVKGEVESGMAYLLGKRSEDPYQEFIPRVVYEASNNNQAPTFEF